MREVSDRDLLNLYTEGRDHAAFAMLVRRHIAFVYSAALRQVRDPALADDVTQAVMIVLARRAGSIRAGVILQSWLFAVTRNAAHNAMKMQSRRRFHEQQAAAARPETTEPRPVSSGDTRRMLDAAIARLPEGERSGVLLHYFSDHSHQQVGAALGITAEAARKRVARALERMRLFLRGRGVTVEATALAAALRADAASAAAPLGLVESAVNVAMLSNTGAGSSSSVIAAGVARMLTLSKLKLAASISLVAVGIAGATAVPLMRLASHSLMTTTTLVAASGEPATQPATFSNVARVNADTRIEFLGVSQVPCDEDSWFSIAGQHIEMPAPDLIDQEVHNDVQPEHMLVMRVYRPKGTVVAVFIDDAMMVSNSHRGTDAEESYLLVSRFKLNNQSDTVGVRLGIATTEWKAIAASEDAAQQAEVDAGEYGTITFMPPEADDLVGGTKIEVHHQPIEIPNRLVATDKSGKEHFAGNVNVNRTNDDVVSSHGLGDVPMDEIKSVRLEVRGFDKFVVAKEISLTPGHVTSPQVSVQDAK